MWAFKEYGTITEYITPLFILLSLFVYKSWQVFSITCEMVRGALSMKEYYDVYQCNDTVVMDGDGGEESIVFTDGWTYQPVGHYKGGYIMVNDHGDVHYVPYYFLKLHFKKVDNN